MATGISCDDCGTDVPSLGSLQMHRLRYHSGSSAGQAPPTLPAGSPPPPPPSPPASEEPGSGRRRRRVAVLGVTIVALLAGGAFAATRPGADRPSSAELTATAQGAVLTKADFPAGWAQDPPDNDESVKEQERALAECLGAPYDDSPDVAQTSFSSTGLSVSSDFTIAPTLEWARADFATLLDGDAPGCFAKVLRVMLDAEKPAGTTYDINVTRFDPTPFVPPAVVRNTAGLRAAITLRQGTLAVPMTFDAIMIRHDRIQATVTFNTVGVTSFPSDLMRSLTGAVADRLG